MTYERFVKKYVLSPNREAIGKSLARNAKQAFAKHSIESDTMRKALFARIHRMVAEEMKKILNDATYSVHVQGMNRDNFKVNTWKDQYTTLSRIAPVLIGILDACIPRARYSCKSSKRHSIITSCVAVLVKSQSKLNISHLLISLILYFGHAGKQVGPTNTHMVLTA